MTVATKASLNKIKNKMKERKSINVGFEVLTAVIMKNSIFWDIIWCNPVKINRRFGGIH
jgi:hypothetical protein